MINFNGYIFVVGLEGLDKCKVYSSFVYLVVY